MNVMSFRAECQHDINKLKEELVKAQVGSVIVTYPDRPPGFADVEVEMKSYGDIEQVRALMNTVFDGHVMGQTLRPCLLKDNSLERM